MVARCAQLLALSTLLSLPSLIEPYLGTSPGALTLAKSRLKILKSPLSCVMISEQELSASSSSSSNRLLQDAPATLLSEVGREGRKRQGGNSPHGIFDSALKAATAR